MKGSMSTELGIITISPEVIAKYAGSVAVECFGIVGMAAVNMKDGLVRLLKKDSLTYFLCCRHDRHGHIRTGISVRDRKYIQLVNVLFLSLYILCACQKHLRKHVCIYRFHSHLKVPPILIDYPYAFNVNIDLINRHIGKFLDFIFYITDQIVRNS